MKSLLALVVAAAVSGPAQAEKYIWNDAPCVAHFVLTDGQYWFIADEPDVDPEPVPPEEIKRIDARTIEVWGDIYALPSDGVGACE